MAFRILIDNVNRTSEFTPEGFSRREHLNERVDTLSINLLRYTDGQFRPRTNQTIHLWFDEGGKSTLLFGGVIIGIHRRQRRGSANYTLRCKDFTHFLDRRIITERYEDMSLRAIVSALVTKYSNVSPSETFTLRNVPNDVTVSSITFNGIYMTQCFDKLATHTAHSWFVDYDKDIKFFSRFSFIAPFNISGGNVGNDYVYDSVQMEDDLTQVRNRVIVRGGTKDAPAVEVRQRGDGSNLVFDTIYTFAETPEVWTGSTKRTVGIDNVTASADAYCFWNNDEKFVRFKTPPRNNEIVRMRAPHIIRTIYGVSDSASVLEYGIYEFPLNDDTIISEAEATTRGNAELQNFSEQQERGQFRTYRHGLKTGQVIVVKVPGEERTIDALIQEVELTFRGTTDKAPQYIVTFSTFRKVGFIEQFTGFFRPQEAAYSNEAEVLLSFETYTDSMSVSDRVPQRPSRTSPPYSYASARWGYFTYS